MDAEAQRGTGFGDATMNEGGMVLDWDAQGGEGDSGSISRDATVDVSDKEAASASQAIGTNAGDASASQVDAGCVHQGPPVLDPTTLPACQCAGAHCLPTGLVPEGSASMLADCDPPTSKCVPDDFITSGGHFLPSTCVSVGGAEGRCLSDCIPGVEAQSMSLPQATCAAGELCAPCYDPISGKSTGACNLSCDPGPKQPPVIFPKCCNDAGTCVPSESVPDSQRAQLAGGSCPPSVDNYVCAPTEFTAPGGFVPPTCSSTGGGEGHCLSTCLASVAPHASMLPQSSCAAGQVCAPCYDPLSGADTKACRLSKDPGPRQPPFTFPQCCNGNGRCVPKSVVPASEQGQLGKDSCPSDSNDDLCVPTELTDAGGFTPATCGSIAGAEGRCLSRCLPMISAQASRLPQSSCSSESLCAPCYDPLTGADTNACHVSNDSGPERPPFTFPNCCSNRGVCVPTGLVPAARRGLLGLDSCPNDPNQYLCVAPRDFATNPSYKPPSCSAKVFGFFDYRGVCLPDCLGPLSGLEGLLLSQGSCSTTGDKCTPCTNPLTGQNTGACN